ncbi:MAG TPA: hypothetical protein VK541_12835 [Pedobacter sp.]|uniref:hypothetical protein n=1 Tax=Pedobacter sp. TaxID=1411316 RepID=UPI002BDD7288|nr:hypothetical protein [Pedobacter sp.]HMI03367.1 hypothetical protein [Pedobacter sp.]
MKKSIFALLMVVTVFVSCKKDSDKKPDDASRVIRYEITGNFTGPTLIASYTTSGGGTANDPVATLPWTKEITYAANVAAAIIAISGNGGIAGQKVTIVIKRGGSQVGAPIDAVADASGSFSKSAPAIVF